MKSLSSRPRTFAVVVAALATVFTSTTVTAAAAPVEPTATVVAGGTPSHYRDSLRLLAGSPHTLAYARTHSYSADPSLDYPPPANSAVTDLVARDKGGAIRVLDSIPDFEHAYFGWSLSGDMLTALVGPSSVGNQVKWWNVATGDSGVLTLPGPAFDPSNPGPLPTYISAEPDGVLFLTVHGVLKLETTAGEVARWHKVFPTSSRRWTGYASDSAVVLSSIGGGLRYVRFDHPRKVHTLKDGGSVVTNCRGMSAKYAACTLSGIQRPQRYRVLALIPLDGSAPIETRDKKHHGTGPVALAGRKTLFWQRLHIPRHGAIRPILTSRTGHAKKRLQAPRRFASTEMISAYGNAVLLTSRGHKLTAATTARHTKTVAKAPKSPVAVAAFALTTNRALDVDNSGPRSKRATQLLRARSIGSSSGEISVGPPSTLASDKPKQRLAPQVVASGGDYAYITKAPDLTARVHIVRGGKTTVFVTSGRGGIELSGHWFGYLSRINRSSGGETGHEELTVLDLDTGKRTTYGRFGQEFGNGAAIADGKLDYRGAGGSIQQVDLATGTKTELAPPLSNPDNNFRQVRVMAGGGRVGWDIATTHGDGSTTYTDVIRNSDGSTITLDQRLIGLSSDGALLSTVEPDSTTAQVDAFAGPFATSPSAISLRRWDGTTTQVLPSAVYGAVPQVADGRIAWVTAAGTLHITSLT